MDFTTEPRGYGQERRSERSLRPLQTGCPKASTKTTDTNHEQHEGVLYGFLFSISLRALRVLRGGSNCRIRASAVFTLVTLAACGGGGGGGDTPPSELGTLAYVVTHCREGSHSASGGNTLQILRGNAAPVTVVEIPEYSFPPLGLCALYGQFGRGAASTIIGGIQRLGVIPDGSGVVFEVTFDFSILAPLGFKSPLSRDQEGIFFVRSDGSGLRRLGPASRAPANIVVGVPSASGGFYAFSDHFFYFSPDSRTAIFTDIGPGPAGEDTVQVFTLDLSAGTRRQVTHLPAVPPNPASPATPAAAMGGVAEGTIFFWSRTNPEGLNPENLPALFRINSDGSGLVVVKSELVAQADSQVLPIFSITSSAIGTVWVTVPGTPLNPAPDFYATSSLEVFVVSGVGSSPVPSSYNFLQLTNFHRVDTRNGAVSADGQRIYFVASADPFGTNPTENCQIFSIDALGAGLRQVTQFRAVDHSETGCLAWAKSGCFIGVDFFGLFQDRLLFESNCDPLGTNPNGAQFFAMRPDGTALRQLTNARGVVANADGSVDVELPGPFAYSPRVR